MEKLDLTKQYKSYYSARLKPEIVNIEPAVFLSLTGKGDPSGSSFAADITALYATAYTIKFACKTKGRDFTVAKLEGLWWYDEEKYKGRTISEASLLVPRNEWEYRLLIRLPEFVGPHDVKKATEAVVAGKKIMRAAGITFYETSEGAVVQMLHIGPFADEPATLEIMAAFMDEHRLGRNGLHHEIYLSDFRKTAPGKLKTILREPVKKL